MDINNNFKVQYGHTTLHITASNWAYGYITPPISTNYAIISLTLSTINAYWGQTQLAGFGINWQFQICGYNTSTQGDSVCAIDYILVGY